MRKSRYAQAEPHRVFSRNCSHGTNGKKRFCGHFVTQLVTRRELNKHEVVVLDAKPHSLQVQTPDSPRTAVRWWPRITFTFITNQGASAKRTYLVSERVSFGMAIQRAQGHTLDRTCFHLTLDRATHPWPFCLYSGISRVRQSEDTVILTTQD